MNQINEVIDTKSASCRDMYLPDLWYILKHDQMKFWSWGVDNRKNVVDRQYNPRMLRIKVSGHHHKGHVYIFLNGLDLFDVYLTTTTGKIKDRTPEMGIYNDELADWIDEKVERIPAYNH
jgi:hypothetical protein